MDDGKHNTLTVEVLAPFKRRIFIETGTGSGAGIYTALQAGFKQIISIEAHQGAYDIACKRFADNPAVTILFGDSAQVLYEVLPTVLEPVTFWLDAHFGGDDIMDKRAISRCPILNELRIIAYYAIKTHHILIDDIRYFRATVPGWGSISLGDITENLRSINPAYRFRFAAGIVPDDILIAEVPNVLPLQRPETLGLRVGPNADNAQTEMPAVR